MTQLFGTDGICGVANEYPITPEVALHIGRAVAHLTKSMSCDAGIMLTASDVKHHCDAISTAANTELGL